MICERILFGGVRVKGFTVHPFVNKHKLSSVISMTAYCHLISLAQPVLGAIQFYWEPSWLSLQVTAGKAKWRFLGAAAALVGILIIPSNPSYLVRPGKVTITAYSASLHYQKRHYPRKYSKLTSLTSWKSDEKFAILCHRILS